MGNMILGQFIKHCLCCTFFFTHSFPALVWIPTHELQSFMKGSIVHLPTGSNSSRTALGWFLSMWCMKILQEQTTPVWVPHDTTVLPGVCSCMGSPQAVAFLRKAISTCSISGSPVACRVDVCSTMVLLGLQGDSLSHHCLGPEELFLSHILNPLSQLLLQSIFYPFLNMLSLSLVGSVLARGRSLLDSAGTPVWKCPTWEQILMFSYRCHPCSPSHPHATKTLPLKPNIINYLN